MQSYLLPPHLSFSRFSSVVVSLGERGSPTVTPPPSPTGDTSPPSDRVGGSKRLLERSGKLGKGARDEMYCNFSAETSLVGAFMQ